MGGARGSEGGAAARHLLSAAAPGSTPAPPPDCVGVCARARASRSHTLPIDHRHCHRSCARVCAAELRDPADQDNK